MSELIHNLTQDYELNPESYPHLILGQLERVGSTFYLDMLEKTQLVHNEPYKQLIPKNWKIARGYYGRIDSIDEFLNDPDVDDFHKVWYKNFVLSKYEPNNQVLKETNLYFAVNNLLESFPFRTVEVLSRNPLGIVSSFKRNNLFEQWNYARLADTLEYQSTFVGDRHNNEYQKFFLDTEDWQKKLTWLIGLNSLLLSQALEIEDIKLTEYEDLIQIHNPDKHNDRNEGSIFGTNVNKKSDDFPNRLSNQEIDSIVESAEECIGYVELEFDNLSLFRGIFSKYFNGPEYESSVIEQRKSQSKISILEEQKIDNTELAGLDFIAINPESNIKWGSSLVTNREMQNFLNDLIANGLDTNLLYLLLRSDMPTERGGRLQFDSETNLINLVKGFETHPAYWITWLSSAMFATYVGKQLPTSSEWTDAYSYRFEELNGIESNHSYANDDTVPTGKLTNGLPNDFFGNLKIWCEDWSSGTELRLSKNLAGISWKHYLHDNYQPISEKPFLTNSRIIGSRLIDRGQDSKPTSAKTLVELLATFAKKLRVNDTESRSKVAASNHELAELFS